MTGLDPTEGEPNARPVLSGAAGASCLEPSAWHLTGERGFQAGHRQMLERSFRLPDGAEHTYTLRADGDSVCVLALTARHQVVLARQFRPGPKLILDELPGGYLAPNEDPVTAGLRELAEETGYFGSGELVGSAWHCAYSTTRRHVILVRQAEPGLATADPSEPVQVVLRNLDEFRQQALAGQLTNVDGALLALATLGTPIAT